MRCSECTKNKDRDSLLRADSTMNLSIDTALDLMLMFRRVKEQAIKQLDFLEQFKIKC